LKRFLQLLAILILTTGVVNGAEIKFHVSVFGSPKLHPGDETTLTLLIENEGTETNFPLNENTSKLLQLVTTAKDLRVELDDSNVPIKVESANPQLVGDLPSGRIAKVSFLIRVDDDAELGEYRIPVKLRFTKVTYSFTSAGALVTFNENEFDVEYLKVEIAKKDYDFDVLSVNSSLKAGRECVVSVVVENTGNEALHDATLYINATPPLVPNPKASSVYLGDVEAGERAKASFKVYVMEGAMNGTYPVTLVMMFRTSSGKLIALSKSVGLEVSKEEQFVVTEVESFLTSPKTVPEFSQIASAIKTLNPKAQQSSKLVTIPSRGFVFVSVKNVGESVSEAEAILTFDNPLIKVENSPFVGDFKSGEVKSFLFYVTSLAPPGKYRAQLVVRFKNEMGDEESVKESLEVEVSPSPPLKVEKVYASLGVGSSGEVKVEVRNSLSEVVSSAEFVVVPSNPLIIPLSPVAFLSDVKPGETGQIKFRLSVSDEATSGSYELYLIEKFSLKKARDLVSVAEVPIVVEPKTARFEILSIDSELHPDETGDVIVRIRNAGDTTI